MGYESETDPASEQWQLRADVADLPGVSWVDGLAFAAV
jgi:hypothetical protein